MSGNVKVVLKSVFDDKGIQQAQKSFGTIGNSLKKVGGAVAAAFSVAAIANFAGQAIKAAEAAQVANNRLDQIAKSMGIFGSQTGAVTNRLKDFADEQMMIIGQDDELIKSTQAKLLTFKDLAATATEAGGAFDRATLAAFDLAAAGFGTAESNAVQLGKALQDPIKGLTALTRSGVTFTNAEKDKIKALVASGKELEAQDMILKAIEAQVGGTSAATVTGFQKIKLAFGEAQEVIGNALMPAFDKLVPVITSLAEKVAPILARVMESLAPIFITIVESLDPLLEALKPLFDVFVMIADIIGEALALVLPILIKLIGMLTPIIKQLAQAFMPLVQKLLPIFARLINALMPFLEILADFITYVLVPGLEMLVNLIGDYLVTYLDTLATAFETVGNAVAPLWEKAKPFFTGLGNFQGKAPKIVSFIDAIGFALADVRKQLGPLGFLLGPVLQLLGFLRDRAASTAKNVRAANSSVLDAYNYNKLVNQPTPLTPIVTGGDDPGGDGGPGGTDVAAARARVQKLINDAQKKVTDAQKNYRKAVSAADKAFLDNELKIRQDYGTKLLEIIQQSKNRIRDAYKGVAEFTVSSFLQSFQQVEDARLRSFEDAKQAAEETGEAFTQVFVKGDPVKAYLDNLRAKLASNRKILDTSARLLEKGFSQTFIEQIIATGESGGIALAEGLLASSPETIAEIQALFKDIEYIANNGADNLATDLYNKQGLATQELVALYESTNQELLDALAQNFSDYSDALGEAADALRDALVTITEDFDKAIADLDGKLGGLMATIRAFRAMLTGAADDSIMATKPVTGGTNPNQPGMTSGLWDIFDMAGAAGVAAANAVAFPDFAGSATATAATVNKPTTVVNVNVATDQTQSTAQVGAVIANAISKYTATGGKVLL